MTADISVEVIPAGTLVSTLSGTPSGVTTEPMVRIPITGDDGKTAVLILTSSEAIKLGASVFKAGRYARRISRHDQ